MLQLILINIMISTSRFIFQGIDLKIKESKNESVCFFLLNYMISLLYKAFRWFNPPTEFWQFMKNTLPLISICRFDFRVLNFRFFEKKMFYKTRNLKRKNTFFAKISKFFENSFFISRFLFRFLFKFLLIQLYLNSKKFKKWFNKNNYHHK